MELTKEKSRHHHGNLQAALVEAGISIIRADGLEALSLRKCAAMAGVSHAAPAHHFGNLDGLKQAIAQEAFARFTQFMRSHADAGDDTPRARLHGICLGYLAFARAEPALYAMIFCYTPNTPPADKGPNDIARDRTRGPAYQLLRETCAPFVPAGTDPVVIETQVWSLVHGFALLCQHGRLGPEPPSDETVLAMLDRIG
ncbi:TetR/AcrR family transcriptional regulator [Pacificoceanicola onchidii]|uniref:TetR/AcrR family transcriptional regulator n=1 Tax=Pacificoceanicola onchidii TaxID=2562685 RepID=UPI0010A3690A|nr:TetR/AcrR family transcriptional regulator [Pacificoceanicola onchidii]